MLEVKAIEKKRAKVPAVVVKNVTKEFVIPHERRTTLFENLKGAFRPSTYEAFTALKNVSFTVERGESVGIIGDNGSGKSTLLKIISRILRPTRGSVEVNGRITPFLELGVGFQPDLTARENIEVYSTIMGLSDKEIAKNIDSVLEFAGLTKFRDTKLKNFSSGMQVRLAFATAIQREPDILLVDEVLAVGDMDFQQKCLDVFAEYKKKGVTMLFVSHDLNSVRKFCDKAVLFRNGRIVEFGETNSVIDRYIYGSNPSHAESPPPEAVPAPEVREAKAENTEVKAEERKGNNKVVIKSLEFIDKYGSPNANFSSGDPMTVRVHYEVGKEIEDLDFGIIFYNDAGTYCYGTTTEFKKVQPDRSIGEKSIDLIIDRIPMLEGRFYITIAAAMHSAIIYDWKEKAYSFIVHKDTQDLGLFEIPCTWVKTPAGNGR